MKEHIEAKIESLKKEMDEIELQARRTRANADALVKQADQMDLELGIRQVLVNEFTALLKVEADE